MSKKITIDDVTHENIIRAWVTELVFRSLKRDPDTLEQMSTSEQKHAMALLKSDIDRLEMYWIDHLMRETMSLVDWEILMSRVYRQFEQDDLA